MKNYDESVKTTHNPNWPYIPNHHYQILIIGGSGSRKTIVLLNLIKHQRTDINKIYLKILKIHSNQNFHYLLWKGKKIGITALKNPKAFIDCSQLIDDFYENLKDHNRTTKGKILIVFDYMIADMEENKKISPVVTELF